MTTKSMYFALLKWLGLTSGGKNTRRKFARNASGVRCLRCGGSGLKIEVPRTDFIYKCAGENTVQYWFFKLSLLCEIPSARFSGWAYSRGKNFVTNSRPISL